jgi:tape measure domain-containing protein
MAITVRELVTKIGFKVDDAQMKNAETKGQKLATSLKVGIGAAVAGLFAIGKGAIDAASDMEMLTTQFEVMLGSTEAAVKMMDELKTFSAATPFALEDLAKNSQMLLSFGIAQKDVIGTMRMLGDTAGGNSEKLNSLSLAYGKVATKGKASMEEINMMAERGIPIIDTLSEQLKTSKEGFFDMVSKGKVSAEDVKKAFQTMTSEGGMFFKGMEKQSTTFAGLVSTMKDNFKLLLADVGAAVLPELKEIVGTITALAQGPLKDLISSLLKILVPLIKLLAGLVGPLIAVLTPLFEGLLAILEPVVEIIGAVLIPVFKLLLPIVKIFSIVLKFLGSVLKTLTPIFKLVGTLFKAFIPLFKLLGAVLQALSFILKPLIMLLQVLIEAILNPLIVVIEVLTEILNPVIELFGYINQSFALLGEVLSSSAGSVDELNAGLLIMEKIIDFIVEGIGSFISNMGGNREVFKNALADIKARKESMEGSNKESSKATENIKNMTRKQTAINMQNKIAISSKGGAGTGPGSKRLMEDAARSVFSVELQKIILNTGL